jgi:hypothetical protein
MDLVEAIRKELDQAAVEYQESPYDSTIWTRVTHERIGNLAPGFAAANGIGCGMPVGQSIGGKRIEVSIVGGRSPAIRGGFLFDQTWLTWCDDSGSNALAGELEKQAITFRHGEQQERYLISFFCWQDAAVHHHEVLI